MWIQKNNSVALLALTMLVFIPACKRSANTDEALLRELDHIISVREQFYAPREHQTDSLHELLCGDLSHDERFEIYGRLVETYRSYNLDSQLCYTEKRLNMARTPFEKQVSLLNYSEVLMRSGMYHETLIYIDSALCTISLRRCIRPSIWG